MKLVLTLVGPDRQPLAAPLLDEVQALLPDADAPVALADEAVDIPFTAEPDWIPSLEENVRKALAGTATDMAVTPADGRRKRLLIADMDSTFITVECIDELADFAGVRDAVVSITERAMRGEIDFEGALTERVGLMKGLPESALQQAFDERVRLMPGGRTLVRTMKAGGAHAALVSGGFTFFTERVSGLVGFDEHHANRLMFADGRLTGKVGQPILGRAAKLEQLNRLCGVLGIATCDALAVGDGANDLAMIQAAGLGVAYHAKPVTAAAAGARVEHGDLSTLLYYQGIPRVEWVEETEE